MSPSTRRAWIEIAYAGRHWLPQVVAFHPEGVDRNDVQRQAAVHGVNVAFHPEGVDRNLWIFRQSIWTRLSPSTRRAWIEIATAAASSASTAVAFHPEGVDRNSASRPRRPCDPVAFHPEGVDRNNLALQDAETQAVAFHPEGVDRNWRF